MRTARWRGKQSGCSAGSAGILLLNVLECNSFVSLLCINVIRLIGRGLYYLNYLCKSSCFGRQEGWELNVVFFLGKRDIVCIVWWNGGCISFRIKRDSGPYVEAV